MKLVCAALLLLAIAQVHCGVPPKKGSYSVSTATIEVGGYITGGSQEALLFYPSESNNSFEDNGDKKFPVVVFGHGKGCGGEHLHHYYTDINSDLASWGFIVVAPLSCPDRSCDYFDQDLLHTLLEVPKHPELHPIFSQADFSQLGLIAHSMGGVAAVQVAAMAEATNLKALAAFNPCVSYASKDLPKEIKVPTMFITGSLDDVCPGVPQAFDEDPLQPKVLADIKGKTHNDIGDSHSQALNPYGIHFLNCELQGQGCDYLYNASHQDYLCDNGEYEYLRCQVTGQAPSERVS